MRRADSMKQNVRTFVVLSTQYQLTLNYLFLHIDKRITKMSGTNNQKRKRVVLSLKDKVEIINQLKKGEAGKVLADRFGVGAATITDIKKKQ